jgi:putative transposase
MKFLRAYKTEIDPTCKQVEMLLQHAGAARWAFNWGLHKKIEAYKVTGKSPSAIDLHRELNRLKKLPIEEGGVPWMYDSSKCAPQEKLRDLDKAYKNFFRRCKKGDRKKGFPRFKSRKQGIGSFRLYDIRKVTPTHIKLPVIGEVKLKEQGYFPTKGVRILSATVSESAGRWFVSIQVEKEHELPKDKIQHVVGVDVGIKNLAFTSDNKPFENPKALTKLQKVLRIRQKAVSRKQKGSQNRRKATHRLAVLHARIANIRRDSLHKMTSAIAKSASVVVVENLNVAGMMKNHRLARSLSDAALGEIHRQLKYKMKWNGGSVLVADRKFPSSKRCSKCGHVRKELSLSERVYHCENPSCGQVIDRDLNAALNLKSLADSSSVKACCPGSSGHGPVAVTKLLVGQELKREGQND